MLLLFLTLAWTALFSAQAAPFSFDAIKSRKTDFNVRAIDLPSAQSGANRPNAGVFHRTPLSAEYNIFDSERYVLTLDNRALREVAAAAPYEFIEILGLHHVHARPGGLLPRVPAGAIADHRPVFEIAPGSRRQTSEMISIDSDPLWSGESGGDVRPPQKKAVTMEAAMARTVSPRQTIAPSMWSVRSGLSGSSHAPAR